MFGNLKPPCTNTRVAKRRINRPKLKEKEEKDINIVEQLEKLISPDFRIEQSCFISNKNNERLYNLAYDIFNEHISDTVNQSLTIENGYIVNLCTDFTFIGHSISDRILKLKITDIFGTSPDSLPQYAVLSCKCGSFGIVVNKAESLKTELILHCSVYYCSEHNELLDLYDLEYIPVLNNSLTLKLNYVTISPTLPTVQGFEENSILNSEHFDADCVRYAINIRGKIYYAIEIYDMIKIALINTLKMLNTDIEYKYDVKSNTLCFISDKHVIAVQLNDTDTIFDMHPINACIRELYDINYLIRNFTIKKSKDFKDAIHIR